MDVALHAADQGSGDPTLVVSGFVIALAVVFAALRLYTRVFTKAGIKWDDVLILTAVILTLATAVLLLWGNAVDPIGIWVSDNVDPTYVYTKDDVFYLRLAFVTSVLYFTISSTTKLGILLMYNRIFAVSTSFRIQLYLASALVAVFWIGCTVACLTNCMPLKWSWLNGLADERYCFNFNIFWAAAGACEAFLDVLILVIPISVVARMTMSYRRKLTISGIFLLGGFTIVTGLVKVVLGYRPGFRVPSYANTEVWATVHTGMEIVCACLPVLAPLVQRIAKSRFVGKLSSLFSLSRQSKETISSVTTNTSQGEIQFRSSGPSLLAILEEGRRDEMGPKEPKDLLRCCALSNEHWRLAEQEFGVDRTSTER